MARRTRKISDDPAVQEAFEEAARNLGKGGENPLVTEVLPGISQVSDEKNDGINGENPGEQKNPKNKGGRPKNALGPIKSLDDADKRAMKIANEVRDGTLTPAMANAALAGIGLVALNLRFRKTQERKAEDAALFEQVQAMRETNARLRAILIEKGIVPADGAEARAGLNS